MKKRYLVTVGGNFSFRGFISANNEGDAEQDAKYLLSVLEDVADVAGFKFNPDMYPDSWEVYESGDGDENGMV
jgi:hypothetical protein